MIPKISLINWQKIEQTLIKIDGPIEEAPRSKTILHGTDQVNWGTILPKLRKPLRGLEIGR